MSLTVLKAGLQTSVQGAPFRGLRGQAIPASGAADPLALALANRLVGRPAAAAGIEITLTGASFRAETPLAVACTGAVCDVSVNDLPAPQHETIALRAGDRLTIGPARSGCRAYLALSRAMALPVVLGGESTLLMAGIGGYQGRALRDDDRIVLAPPRGGETPDGIIATPLAIRPGHGAAMILRVVPGPESALVQGELGRLRRSEWSVSHRTSRMGLKLDGPPLALAEGPVLQSGAVFPGTLQCPPDGRPYLLGVDGQTTGGYPRIAQVIAADRHLIGQLRPGMQLRFAPVSTDAATAILGDKMALWRDWLPDLRLS